MADGLPLDKVGPPSRIHTVPVPSTHTTSTSSSMAAFAEPCTVTMPHGAASLHELTNSKAAEVDISLWQAGLAQENSPESHISLSLPPPPPPAVRPVPIPLVLPHPTTPDTAHSAVAVPGAPPTEPSGCGGDDEKETKEKKKKKKVKGGAPPPTVSIPDEYLGTFRRFGGGRKQLPLVPPLNFALVATGVYRSGYPNEKNFPFLTKLRIKTIVYLCEEPYLPHNLTQLEQMGVAIAQFKTDGNLEPFTEISEQVLVDALRCVLDPDKQPVLVHCEKGNHRTGCLIGCLRKLMNWSLTSIFAEYRRHTGGNVRVLDLQSIELFSCPELTLPQSTGWVS